VVTDVLKTADRAREVAAEAKPLLRGWLHLGAFPLAVVAGAVLLAHAHDPASELAAGAFAASGTVLFGASALLHRARMGRRLTDLVRRLDHAGIFVLIAGSYTAFAVLLLDRHAATVVLVVAWSLAAVGMVFRLGWTAAPRWLYTLVYCVMGCGGAVLIRDFAAASNSVVVVLLAVGGALYLLGGLVYAIRWPDPSPRWFGFHEVFHSLTVVAFAVHCAAVSILIRGRG